MKSKLISLIVCTTMTLPVLADSDFGVKVERLLRMHSSKYLGIAKPLTSSATGTEPRRPGQSGSDLVKVARGLHAHILTRQAANWADQFAFWPSDENPTHAVFCIESTREQIAPGKFNPSLQAIDLATGEVTTLLRGMHRCDGIRRTAWGTIVATEEADDGGAYEILDPLALNATITDRTTGATTDPARVTKRPDLPTMAWEGLTVLPSGVVIAGDELRPGTGVADKDGGAIFKFVPLLPHAGGWIDNLSDSPLASGKVYAMQISCKNSRQQFGQGCEIGNAAWVSVSADSARDDADEAGATGYYRPEDLHRDPLYDGPGVRFCWTNTGNEGARNYGEVMCAIDNDPLLADPDTRSVVVNRFVEGDADFNSFDNLAFQPVSGHLYVVEDHPHGDVFACLRDGADRDLKSDGCVKILSVKDATAEPTGFAFTADGRAAILAIQHSKDDNCPPTSDCGQVDGYPTDDILVITGFRTTFMKRHRHHEFGDEKDD